MRLRWSNDEFESSYASPIVFELAGRPQLIIPVAGEIVSLDPESGRLMWRHEHANSHRTFLSGPVVGADDVLFASAYFLGSVGLRLAADGPESRALENPGFQLSHSNSIRDGDLVFGFHNSILAAVDVHTGELAWRHRGFEGGNLVRVGDDYLLLDRWGKLSRLSLDREGPACTRRRKSWTGVRGRLRPWSGLDSTRETSRPS